MFRTVIWAFVRSWYPPSYLPDPPHSPYKSIRIRTYVCPHTHAHGDAHLCMCTYLHISVCARICPARTHTHIPQFTPQTFRYFPQLTAIPPHSLYKSTRVHICLCGTYTCIHMYIKIDSPVIGVYTYIYTHKNVYSHIYIYLFVCNYSCTFSVCIHVHT